MTRILHDLPFFDRLTTVSVRGARVPVKSGQIVIWVSVLPPGQDYSESRHPRFPATLDTGNNFNVFIRESHLRQWADIDPRLLRSLGPIRHRGQAIPTIAARVWLHRNRRGERDVLSNRPPYPMETRRGIAVYPQDLTHAPRLPLLGLHALMENHLHLHVDAERCRVSLRSPDWRTWLARWFF